MPRNTPNPTSDSRSQADPSKAMGISPPSRLFRIDRSLLQGLSPRALSHEREAYFEDRQLSAAERLFYQVWTSEGFKTVVFRKGQWMGHADDIPAAAYVVTSGDVLAKGPWGSGQLGPGGVIGLAEGLCDQPLQESFQALGVVNAKLIPIDSAIRELQRIKPSLRGAFRITISKILGDDVPVPAWLGVAR